jgi:hypothetical protein
MLCKRFQNLCIFESIERGQGVVYKITGMQQAAQTASMVLAAIQHQ